MLNAAFLLTNVREYGTKDPTGFDVRETAELWSMLVLEGADVAFYSPQGGHTVPVHRPAPSDAVRTFRSDSDAWAAATEETIPIASLDPQRVDLLYLVGGHGSMWDFWPNPDVQSAVSRSYQAGATVAAICHGVAGLLDATDGDGRPLLHRRRVTAFSDAEERARGLDSAVPFSLEQKLIAAGARFSAGPDRAPHAVADGQIVTAQNPYSIPPRINLIHVNYAHSRVRR